MEEASPPFGPPMNLYGDELLPTPGGYGANVSIQRLDDLDRASLRFALDSQPEDGAFVDLGCGVGGQGLRFAALGLETWLYDLTDISARLYAIRELFPKARLFFTSGDARTLPPEAFPPLICCLYSQRFVSFLTYAEARTLFSRLRPRMACGSKVFISAGGLHSEFGDSYPARDKPVEQRFCPVAAHPAKTHNAYAPMCLYDEEELARLMSESGFSVLTACASAFGNVKVEATA